MMNMNLATDQAAGPSRQKKVGSMGLLMVTLFFILTAAATGGLLLWKNSLKAQIKAVNDEYAEKYSKLVGEERNKDVVDFQNRIKMANVFINEKNVALESLQFVEKNIVSGIYLTSYKNDKKKRTLSLEGISGNYDAIAKQTLSFKNSDFFFLCRCGNDWNITRGRNYVFYGIANQLT